MSGNSHQYSSPLATSLLRRCSAPVHGAALALTIAPHELVQVEDERRRASPEVQLHLLVFAASRT